MGNYLDFALKMAHRGNTGSHRGKRKLACVPEKLTGKRIGLAVTRYAYNSQGKVCSITDQSGNTETFRYDREGRETEHTDRNGAITETKYNVYGKPVMQICTDKKGNRQIMGTWEYDSFGQLTKSVAGGFCYIYEYRPDGKLLNKWSSGRKALSCTYYRDGSLKSQTDASGKTVFYAYDENGRLKYLKENKEDTGRRLTKAAETVDRNTDDDGKNVSVLTEYIYTAAGRIKEIITKNGIRTSYTYDEDGNISRLTIGDGTEAGLLYDAFMFYDLNGNRPGKSGSSLGITKNRDKMSVTYRYDSMNRLTNEDRNGAGERYAYDLCGNRLIKEPYRGGCVDATEGYRYNERNELTERVRAGSLTRYRYDKNGSLIREEEEGRQSKYRYDLLNRQTYVRTLEEKEQESTAYITGQENAVENIYQYDAFGNLLEKHEDVSNRILYTGQQYDQETGQYYLRARYYNPIVGRFLQEDSYRGDGLNLYAYCANNPVVYYDPSGRNKCDDPGENTPPKTQGGEILHDEAQVVRGGTCKAQQFTDGSGVTTGVDGKLDGVSVSSGNGVSVEELSARDPHGQIGVTTVGAIREAGGDVTPSPSEKNPYHCTLSGITAEQAEELFSPTQKNPSKNKAR